MRDDGRTTNLLATLGLLMADEQLRAIEEATGLQPSAAAALVTIGHAPGQPIDFLRRVLRRSHSAVVRQVGSLVNLGLVVKQGGDDARAVSLTLTPAGSKLVRRALEQRGRVVQGYLGVLTEQEQHALTRALEKLLARAVSTDLDAYQICRLCDADACTDRCPVETALS